MPQHPEIPPTHLRTKKQIISKLPRVLFDTHTHPSNLKPFRGYFPGFSTMIDCLLAQDSPLRRLKNDEFVKCRIRHIFSTI
jgi:hypothetical protein